MKFLNFGRDDTSSMSTQRRALEHLEYCSVINEQKGILNRLRNLTFSEILSMISSSIFRILIIFWSMTISSSTVQSIFDLPFTGVGLFLILSETILGIYFTTMAIPSTDNIIQTFENNSEKTIKQSSTKNEQNSNATDKNTTVIVIPTSNSTTTQSQLLLQPPTKPTLFLGILASLLQVNGVFLLLRLPKQYKINSKLSGSASSQLQQLEVLSHLAYIDLAMQRLFIGLRGILALFEIFSDRTIFIIPSFFIIIQSIFALLPLNSLTAIAFLTNNSISSDKAEFSLHCQSTLRNGKDKKHFASKKQLEFGYTPQINERSNSDSDNDDLEESDKNNRVQTDEDKLDFATRLQKTTQRQQLLLEQDKQQNQSPQSSSCCLLSDQTIHNITVLLFRFEVFCGVLQCWCNWSVISWMQGSQSLSSSSTISNPVSIVSIWIILSCLVILAVIPAFQRSLNLLFKQNPTGMISPQSSIYFTLLRLFIDVPLQLISGSIISIIHSLSKKDYYHYNHLTSLANILTLAISIPIQILMYAWCLSSPVSGFYSYVQIFLLAVQVPILTVKVFLMFKAYPQSITKSVNDLNFVVGGYETFQDIQQMSIQVHNKNNNNLNNQMIQLSYEHHKGISELLQLQEFCLIYENDFQILSRNGHTLLKLTQIKDVQETCRLVMTLLKASRISLSVIVDPLLITINKHSIVMFLLLRNSIGIDSFKLFNSPQIFLEFFEPLELDFAPAVKRFQGIQEAQILSIQLINRIIGKDKNLNLATPFGMVISDLFIPLKK